jgi:hypothetical protein
LEQFILKMSHKAWTSVFGRVVVLSRDIFDSETSARVERESSYRVVSSITMIKLSLLVFFLLPLTRASIPPKIKILEVPKTSIGGEATLFCSLDSGTKPVQFIWTKDGVELSPSLITSHQTSSTIFITPIKLRDKGRYTCSVRSSFGEDKRSGDLIVSGKDVICLS